MDGALVYARLSSRKQVEQNNTLQQQLDICKNQADILNAKVLGAFEEIAPGDKPDRMD